LQFSFTHEQGGRDQGPVAGQTAYVPRYRLIDNHRWLSNPIPVTTSLSITIEHLFKTRLISTDVSARTSFVRQIDAICGGCSNLFNARRNAGRQRSSVSGKLTTSAARIISTVTVGRFISIYDTNVVAGHQRTSTHAISTATQTGRANRFERTRRRWHRRFFTNVTVAGGIHRTVAGNIQTANASTSILRRPSRRPISGPVPTRGALPESAQAEFRSVRGECEESSSSLDEDPDPSGFDLQIRGASPKGRRPAIHLGEGVRNRHTKLVRIRTDWIGLRTPASSMDLFSDEFETDLNRRTKPFARPCERETFAAVDGVLLFNPPTSSIYSYFTGLR